MCRTRNTLLAARATSFCAVTFVELSPSPRSNRGWVRRRFTPGQCAEGAGQQCVTQPTSPAPQVCNRHTSVASKESRRPSVVTLVAVLWLPAVEEMGAKAAMLPNSPRFARLGGFWRAHVPLPRLHARSLNHPILLQHSPPVRHLGVRAAPCLSSTCSTCRGQCQNASDDATWPTYSVARTTSSRRVRSLLQHSPGSGNGALPMGQGRFPPRATGVALCWLATCAGTLLGGGGLEAFVLCTSSCCNKKLQHLLSIDGGAVFSASAFAQQHGSCARHKQWRDFLKANEHLFLSLAHVQDVAM